MQGRGSRWRRENEWRKSETNRLAETTRRRRCLSEYALWVSNSLMQVKFDNRRRDIRIHNRARLPAHNRFYCLHYKRRAFRRSQIYGRRSCNNKKITGLLHCDKSRGGAASRVTSARNGSRSQVRRSPQMGNAPDRGGRRKKTRD